MCFAPQRRALFRHLNFKKCSECAVLSIFWLRDVLRAAATCTFSTSQLLKNVPKLRLSWAFWLWNVFGARTTFAFFDIQLLKVLWMRGALYILTSRCASRRCHVHFFDISASKKMFQSCGWAEHFDFEMSLAPERRLLFFDIQLLKVLWSWSAFCTFSTSKFALRHYSMQFFYLSSGQMAPHRRFSEPTFRPSGATNHWEKHCFATSPHFRAPASSFFWLSLLWSSLFFSFSSLTLPTSAFPLSILSEIWYLNFLRRGWPWNESLPYGMQTPSTTNWLNISWKMGWVCLKLVITNQNALQGAQRAVRSVWPERECTEDEFTVYFLLENFGVTWESTRSNPRPCESIVLGLVQLEFRRCPFDVSTINFLRHVQNKPKCVYLIPHPILLMGSTSVMSRLVNVIVFK